MNNWKDESDQTVESLIHARIAENPQLNPMIGLFFLRMSEVEHQINRNIAHLLMPVQNYEVYHDLTQWVMIDAKCKTLVAALKSKGSVGPELNNRINYFRNYVNGQVRNKIAHSLIAERDGIIYACNNGATLDPVMIPQRPNNRTPPGMSYTEFGKIVLWLIDFYKDLATLASITWPEYEQPELYELHNPVSSRENPGKQWD